MSLPPALFPQVLAPRGQRAEPGVEPMSGAAERREQGVLEDGRREHRIVFPDQGVNELLDRRPDDVEKAGRARPVRELEVPPLGDLAAGPPYRFLGEGDGGEVPEVARKVVRLIDNEVDPVRWEVHPPVEGPADVRVEEERVGSGDDPRTRHEPLRELVGAQVLLPGELVEIAGVGELASEPFEDGLDVRLQDPGIVRAAVEVGEVDLPALGELRSRDQGRLARHRPLGRPLAVGAQLPVLLRGRPLHLGDVLQEEAPTGPTLQTDREQGPVEPVGDRSRLVQDLDLLRVRPDEVEDLVVGRLRVLEEGCEGRDRLPTARGGVDQEGSAPLDEVRDLGKDPVLARSDPVREQVGGARGGGCARRRPGSGVPSPRSGF